MALNITSLSRKNPNKELNLIELEEAISVFKAVRYAASFSVASPTVTPDNSDKEEVFTKFSAIMPQKAKIIGAYVTCDTTTSGADATSGYGLNLRNVNDSADLLASNQLFGNVTAGVPVWVPADQNQIAVAGDRIALGITQLDDNDPNPTDLSSANFNVEVVYELES